MKEKYLKLLEEQGIEVMEEIINTSPNLPHPNVFKLLLESAKNGDMQDLEILRDRLAGWLAEQELKNGYR